MRPFGRMKVGFKLVLLAGVPVLGALLLSLLIARDAQVRSQTAASLGSIEDLAHLTDEMTNVVHQLQLERAQIALSVGIGEPNRSEVAAEEARTDRALEQLAGFLDKRDEAKLPSTLRGNLTAARSELAKLPDVRRNISASGFRLREFLDFYSNVNGKLIAATAALTQLSDDGELLRSLSRLVAIMQVIERGSIERDRALAPPLSPEASRSIPSPQAGPRLATS